MIFERSIVQTRGSVRQLDSMIAKGQIYCHVAE